MSQLGIRVMLNMLATGNTSGNCNAFVAAIGRTIKTIEIKDNALWFHFEDGSSVRMWDSGQSCCERRYMNCDDDLASFTGATLVSGTLKPGPSNVGKYDEQDCEFLEIETSKGTFTVANYNEHNGYYGGFWIVAEPLAG